MFQRTLTNANAVTILDTRLAAAEVSITTGATSTSTIESTIDAATELATNDTLVKRQAITYFNGLEVSSITVPTINAGTLAINATELNIPEPTNASNATTKTYVDGLTTTQTNNLAGEVTRATAAELVLTNDLASEVTRATAAELVLTNNLADELTARAAAELVLTNALAAEVTARAAADTALDGRLDAAEVTLAAATASATDATLVLRAETTSFDKVAANQMIIENVLTPANSLIITGTSMSLNDESFSNSIQMSLSEGSQSISASGDLVLSAGTINMRDLVTAVNVPDPTSSSNPATKSYVDAAINGLQWKAPCRVATTANLTPTFYAANALSSSANGALSIDGIALSVNDRVLVKDQSAGTSNGIYHVADPGSAGTTWILARATDSDNSPSGEVMSGMCCMIAEGSTNGDCGFVLTTNNPITLDTTILTFTQFTLASGAVSMGGEASGSSSSVTLSNSAVIGKALTGYSEAAGTVAATDTLLQGFNKIGGTLAEATDANTPSTLVKRSAGGEISVGSIATGVISSSADISLSAPSGTITIGSLTTDGSDPTPTNIYDIIYKGYLESLPDKSPVRLATTAALPACTATTTTLTGDANGILSIDGSQAAGRVLIKDQAAPAQNGIYTVTTAGSAGTPFILTRTSDSISGSTLNPLRGAKILTQLGTTNASTIFVCTNLITSSITTGSTNVTFSNITIPNATVIGKVLTGYTSGAGLLASTDTILQAIQKLNGNTVGLSTIVGAPQSAATAGQIAQRDGSGNCAFNDIIVANITCTNDATFDDIGCDTFYANTSVASPVYTGGESLLLNGDWTGGLITSNKNCRLYRVAKQVTLCVEAFVISSSGGSVTYFDEPIPSTWRPATYYHVLSEPLQTPCIVTVNNVIAVGTLSIENGTGLISIQAEFSGANNGPTSSITTTWFTD